MKNQDKIKEKIKKYALENGISLSCKTVVGLSGGADSTALLLILLSLNASVTAVHVNHGIRGDEADRDEEFCRQLCAARGVEFLSYRIDVPALSEKRHTGIEETARDERKRIFKQVCEQTGCDTVALAHNGCDRAETVIFNLCRGAGLNGLASIKPKRVDGGITFIRPILCLSRDEILAYLSEEGQNYVTDSTNFDTDYTRNYIRGIVLPSLERINHAYLSNINKASDAAAEADDYITQCAYSFLKNSPEPDITALLSLHSAVYKKVLEIMYSAVSKDSLSEVHLRSITVFLSNAENGKRLQLPSLCELYIDNGAVRFVKRGVTDEYNDRLLPGEYKIPGQKRIVFVENANTASNQSEYLNIYKIVKRIKINSDMINSGIFIRNRCDGDTVRYSGMTHSVKKILSTNKVPSSQRKGYPVLYDKNGIFFVPPFSVRDGVAGDGGIYITYCEE